MQKIVLFVEGQAEQIFIREMLLRRYVYDGNIVCIRCLQLISEQLETAEYDYGNENAPNYYMIINAGGDNKVMSAMLRRQAGLIAKGYQMIIGLRDMYSKFYRAQSPSVVSSELNKEFLMSARQQIQEAKVSNIIIHFAIMEVETWMLALLDKWKGDIQDSDILQYFNPDDNLEEIYHPAEIVTAITGISGVPYDKHASQVNSIMSNIGWDDYKDLYQSNRCPSFNAFVNDLAIME